MWNKYWLLSSFRAPVQNYYRLPSKCILVEAYSSHPDGQPWPRPTHSHCSNFSNCVCLSPVSRGLSRSLQQQRTMHSGGQRLALHLPVRMERGRVSRSHGNTLRRWQGQWRRYICVHSPGRVWPGMLVCWMDERGVKRTKNVGKGQLDISSLQIGVLRNGFSLKTYVTV